VREGLVVVTEYAVLAIDAMAMLLIVVGTVEAFVGGAVGLVASRSSHQKRDVWIRYARWLVVGLTFQLAADIIETSIRTDWDSIGRLAAIAVIRTFLNYFLERDLRETREVQRADTERAERPFLARESKGA
jgi:uncharacterized membrane protein